MLVQRNGFSIAVLRSPANADLILSHGPSNFFRFSSFGAEIVEAAKAHYEWWDLLDGTRKGAAKDPPPVYKYSKGTLNNNAQL